jgi:hypothetical protein
MTCPRCRYYMFGARWAATYGSCMAPIGPRRRIVWLAERPARQGEAWALGCTFCASYECRSVGDSTAPPSRRGPSTRRRGGFGGFCVRTRSLQASTIRFHEESLGHKFAAASWFKPDEPVCITLQATAEDDRLLSGNVPQPQDWVRAWRISRDPRSWQAAEHDDETFNFLCQIRPKAVQRKSWKALCVTMAEVVRKRKRDALRVATTISIAFDDKASRKLLMFKCDTPGLPSLSCLDADKTLLPYGARLAMIGCMPPDLSAMSEYEEDYAQRTARSVLKLFERFCVDDKDLLESLLLKVRVACVDGALIKTATVLRSTRMPNIVLIVRDPAHLIRTSTANPLRSADLFDEQYSRLFSSRHAVLKDFMNSQIWQDQLQACQADILENGGADASTLGGGVKSVLRNMAFVQPRFESEATPRRRYVCLLRAIAQVLMVKACDARLEGAVRKRAKDALDAMEKRSDAVMAGIAGDYGEACVEFLRVFDVDDHDVARTCPELAGFLKFLDAMFIQGRVLDDVRFEDEAAPNVGSRKTLTRIAFEEVQNEYTVSYGNQTRKLWSCGGGVAFAQECKAIMRSIGGVVRDIKDRMAVEVGREDLQAAFVAFDLGAWSRAIARAEGTHIDASMLDARHTRTELCKAAARLCKAFLGIEGDEVGHEWRRMVELALEERSRVMIGPRRAPSEYVRTAVWDVAAPHPIDNRMVWRLVLDGGGVPDMLRPMVLAYFACLHGTGSVERGLGRDKRAVVEPHVGSSRPSAEVEEDNSKCLELHREGPRREQDLFVQSVGSGVLLLTEFSRACAARWLATRGRRFCNASVRKDVGVAEKRALGQHTDAALRRGVRTCFAQIAQQANAAEDAAQPADASRPTILGEHRIPKDLVKGIMRVRGAQELEVVTKGTKRYRELTKTKAREKKQRRAAAGVWAGWTLDRPVMRLGGAAAVQAASACAAAHGAQAKRWLGRTRRASPGQVKAAKGRQVPRRPAAPREEARPSSVGGGTVALRSAICPATRSSTVKVIRSPETSLSTMRAAAVLTVKSKLHDGCTSADDLCKWVVAVAFGTPPVHVNSGVGSIERVRPVAALGRAHELCFTHKFATRYPELAKITSEIAKHKRSKWRVTLLPTAPPSLRGASSRNAQEIDSSVSFVRWLQKVTQSERGSA